MEDRILVRVLQEEVTEADEVPSEEAAEILLEGGAEPLEGGAEVGGPLEGGAGVEGPLKGGAEVPSDWGAEVPSGWGVEAEVPSDGGAEVPPAEVGAEEELSASAVVGGGTWRHNETQLAKLLITYTAQ